MVQILKFGIRQAQDLGDFPEVGGPWMPAPRLEIANEGRRHAGLTPEFTQRDPCRFPVHAYLVTERGLLHFASTISHRRRAGKAETPRDNVGARGQR